MSTIIYCKNTSNDKHSFYLRAYGEDYFMFTQKYRSGVEARFGKGLELDEALNRGIRNHIVRKTAEKILSGIIVLERENNMIFLNKRAKKRQNKPSARNRWEGRIVCDETTYEDDKANYQPNINNVMFAANISF